jgi:hypothetical protein
VARTVQLELESGETVCERCIVADNALLRLRGLIGRPRLQPGEGILIKPCNSVHTYWMRYPIDVVFCDKELQVLRVVPEMPRRRVRGKRGAKMTIELAPGEAARRGVVDGSRLRIT